jgi:hypothetical protein
MKHLITMVALAGVAFGEYLCYQSIETAPVISSLDCSGYYTISEDYVTGPATAVRSINVWMTKVGTPIINLSIRTWLEGQAPGGILWACYDVPIEWEITGMQAPGTGDDIWMASLVIPDPYVFTGSGHFWFCVQATGQCSWMSAVHEWNDPSWQYSSSTFEWEETAFDQFLVISDLSTSMSECTWGSIKALL